MGSAATLNPTCFIQDMARTPDTEAPIATSVATFSFGDHSQYKLSLYLTRFSLISVLGVPGYAADTFTPASYAPLAIASFPSIITFSDILLFHPFV